MAITDREITWARLVVFLDEHLFDPIDEMMAVEFGHRVGCNRGAELILLEDKRPAGTTWDEYRDRVAYLKPTPHERKEACGHLYIEHHPDSGYTRFSVPVKGDAPIQATVENGRLSVDSLYDEGDGMEEES